LGENVAARALIVNADDFGQAASVNRGVARSHEDGVVTSASLMVRWPAAAEAAEYAAAMPTLSVGLHVDLGEWEHRGDGWHARYQVVDGDDEQAVAAELERQLAAFQRLIGRPPTHLDSHQHVHREGSTLRRLLTNAGERLGIPVRGCSPSIIYSGAFYGQSATGHRVPEAISVNALVAIIADLPSGVTELGCHPGELDPGFATTYRDERAVELEVLCDDRVRAAIAAAGVQLRSFADAVET
jgi:predicted glycoside hydrolase/deacetylase ChbG (UPF0249 family)